MEGADNLSSVRERPLILLAEDVGVQVRLTRIHLERANCDVIAVGDGGQAIIRCQAEHPDLIIMDVDMPGVNGFQALDSLRKQETTRHIPIIMLTAHAKDAPLFAEWACEADAFMTKPFNPQELIAQVRRVLSDRYPVLSQGRPPN